MKCSLLHTPPRRLALSGDERGSILILAIGILAVLTIMAITFAMLMRLEMGASDAQSDSVLADLAARAGQAEETQVIRYDDRRYDHFGEPWFWIVNSEWNPRLITNRVDDDSDGIVDEVDELSWVGATGVNRGVVFNNGIVISRYAVHLGINDVGDFFTPGAPALATWANAWRDWGGYYDRDGDGQVNEDPPGGGDEDGDGQVDEDYVGKFLAPPAGPMWSKMGAYAHDNDGNANVFAGLVMDEGGKININACGNLSNGGAHGTNMRLSSFEISLERFFQAYGFTPAEARTIASAIINYRHGIDLAPGRVGIDDDGDNSIISQDGLDNDGDGAIDEPNEGIDEPDEFDPVNPYGDDKPFRSIEELKIALVVQGGYTPVRANQIFNMVREDITVSSFFDEAVISNSNDRLDNYQPPFTFPDGQIDDAVEVGGTRPFAFSVNDWATDGIDNDADGSIDGADPDEEINNWGVTPGDHDMDGFSGDPDEVYVGNTTLPRGARRVTLLNEQFRIRGVTPLSLGMPPGSAPFTIWTQWLTNIVDFCDSDHVPTVVDLNSDSVDNDLNGVMDDEVGIVIGTEGLHITEYMTKAVIDIGRIPGPPFAYFVEDDVNGLVDGDPNDNVDNQTATGQEIAWGYQGNGQWREYGNPDNPMRDGLLAVLRLACGVNVPVPGGLVGNPPTLPTLPRGIYIVRLVGVQLQGIVQAQVYVNNDAIPNAPSLQIVPGDGPDLYIPFLVNIPATAPNVGITIDVWGRKDAIFRLERIEFCAEYVEITNIAKQPINLAGYTLNVGVASFTISANSAQVFDPSNAGTPMPTSIISGASANGSFPIEYGNFILANNQAVYDGCWGNGSGVWGDAPSEDVPVFFAPPAGPLPASSLTIPALGPGNPPPNIWLADASGNIVAGTSPTMDIDNVLNFGGLPVPGFVSMEKTDPAMTGAAATWTTWSRPGWIGGLTVPQPGGLGGSQNDNDNVDNDGDGIVDEADDRTESYANSAYKFFFDSTGTSTYVQPSETAFVNRGYDVALVWDAPMPSVGWIGFVHGGRPWRTIPLIPYPGDPDFPSVLPSQTLNVDKIVDVTSAVRTLARININTASLPVLKACFSDSDALNIYNWRNSWQVSGSPVQGYHAYLSFSSAASDGQNNDFDGNVDETDGSEHGLLEHPQISWQCAYVSDASDNDAYGEAFTDTNGNGVWDTGEPFTDENRNGICDPGVMSDDVHDELDEQVEWFLRYANFMTLRSNAFTIISRGQVTDSLGNILAERKIRAIVERGRTPRGVRVLDFRFLTDY